MVLDSVKSGQILAGPGSTVKSSSSADKAVSENAKNLAALNNPLPFSPPKTKEDPIAKRLDEAINGPNPDMANVDLRSNNHVLSEGREQALKNQAVQYNNTNPIMQGLLLNKLTSQNTQVFSSTVGLKFKTAKEEKEKLTDDIPSPWGGNKKNNLNTMA